MNFLHYRVLIFSSVYYTHCINMREPHFKILLLFLFLTGISEINAHAFTVTEAAMLTLADGSSVQLDQTYAIANQIIPFIDVSSKKSIRKSACHYQFIVSVKPVWNVQVSNPTLAAKPEVFLKLAPSIHPEHPRMMRFTYEEALKKGRKCRSPAELIQSGKKFTGEFVGGEVLVKQMKLDLQGPSVLARMKVRENGTFALSSLTVLKRKPLIQIASRASAVTVVSQKTQVR